MIDLFSDDYFMKQAYRQAQLAFEKDEVPIGCVIVCNQTIISKAHNQTELLKDVTAHAEILAITAAANYLGSKYLDQCTVFTTLEPCPMCAGALRHAKIRRLVYAVSDPKGGFLRFGSEMLHPKTEISEGINSEECKYLLKEFFLHKRKRPIG